MNRIEKYKEKRKQIYEENRKHEEKLKKGNKLSIWLDSLKPKGKHIRKKWKEMKNELYARNSQDVRSGDWRRI